MKLTTPQAVATQVSLAYFGRPTDMATLQLYANLFNVVDGFLQPTLVQQKTFFTTAEAQAIYGLTPTIKSVVTAAFNIVGRVPTDSDMAAWLGWVSETKMDVAQIPWEVMKVALSTESLLSADKQIAWTRLAVSYQLAEDITAHSKVVTALDSDLSAAVRLSDLVKTITSPGTIASMFPSDGHGSAEAFIASFYPLVGIVSIPAGVTRTVDAFSANSVTFSGAGNLIITGGNTINGELGNPGNTDLSGKQNLIILTTGTNTIHAGTDLDTYTLGSGNDTIIVANGIVHPGDPWGIFAGMFSDSTFWGMDKIVGFDMQHDHLALSPNVGVANNMHTNSTLYNNSDITSIDANGAVTFFPGKTYHFNGMSVVQQMGQQIFLAMGTGAVTAFLVLPNADGIMSTYVFHGDGQIGYNPQDVVIELTGVVASGFSYGANSSSTINIVGI